MAQAIISGRARTHLQRGLDAAGQGRPSLGSGRERRGLAAQLPPRDRRRLILLLHHRRGARTGRAGIPHPNCRTHRGRTVAADDDLLRRGGEQMAAAAAAAAAPMAFSPAASVHAEARRPNACSKSCNSSRDGKSQREQRRYGALRTCGGRKRAVGRDGNAMPMRGTWVLPAGLRVCLGDATRRG